MMKVKKFMIIRLKRSVQIILGSRMIEIEVDLNPIR